MKKFCTLILFVCINYLALTQNNFDIGMQYFEKGNYTIADSFLTQHNLLHPGDINSRYNLAIVRLYQYDTCSFCKELFSINNPYVMDQQASELYFKFCGNADTTYYDKKFIPTKESNYRFWEVIEHHKYFDFVIGKIHKINLEKRYALVESCEVKTFITDIFAMYKIGQDGLKVYSVTEIPAKLPLHHEDLEQTLKKSHYYRLLKEELSLSDTAFLIRFIIDKNGKAGRIKVFTRVNSTNVFLNPPINEEIVDHHLYFDSLIANLPCFKPARFRGEAVNFLKDKWIFFE